MYFYWFFSAVRRLVWGKLGLPAIIVLNMVLQSAIGRIVVGKIDSRIEGDKVPFLGS